MSDRTPRAQAPVSEAQLRFFQVLAAILFLLLVCGLGYFFYRQHQGQPVAILVDGRTVTTLDNIQDARRVLRSVRDEAAGSAFANNDPLFKKMAQLQPVSAASALDTEDTARMKLAAALPVTVLADAVTIDGKPFVALPDKDSAQAALDAVRTHYADMPPSAPLAEPPSFHEKVEIVRERVVATLAKGSADDAAPLFWTAPPAKTYTVELHETGWSIARKFHMSFTDFLRANSGHDVNRLAPGDTVNVSATYPPLTVIVKKEQEKDEPILPGAPAQSAGLRRMTLVTTYINGVQDGLGEAVSITTLQRARPRSFVE